MKTLLLLSAALAAAAPAAAQEVRRGEALRGLVSLSAEGALPPEPRAAAESGYEAIEIDPDPERPAFILAADFGGEIVITVDNFTDIGLNRTFRIAPTYQLKLLEVSRPGSYTLYFSYMRFWGSHHSEMVRLNKTFEVK